MSETDQKTEQSDPLISDQGYNILIAGLMVVIMLTLAGLWAMEWGRRKRAENDLANFAEQNRKLQQLAGLPQGGMDMQQLLNNIQPESSVVIPDRADLEKVLLKVPETEALVLDCRTAEMLGFAPGDVIWVRPQKPETSPAEERK
jgi:hypothetical protein